MYFGNKYDRLMNRFDSFGDTFIYFFKSCVDSRDIMQKTTQKEYEL